MRIYDYVDRNMPTLLRRFEKRLRGYRAIGYARDETPLGYAEQNDDLIVEYDDDVIRTLDHESATDRSDDRRLPRVGAVIKSSKREQKTRARTRGGLSAMVA